MGVQLELRLAAAYVLTECDKLLHDQGLSLFVSTDFEAYHTLRAGDAWPNESAFFDRRLNDLLPHNAFWVGGISQTSGQIALTQAVRVDYLGGSTLRELWRVQLQRWFGNDIQTAEIRRKSNVLDQIKGTAAYHGDLYALEELRGGGIAAIAARYAMACAALKWPLDWMYGLQIKRVALSGFGMREGYWHWEQIGDEWRWGAPFLDKEDFVASMSAPDLLQMFSAYHPHRNA